ncbi:MULTISPECIES: hypothetical protein [unclassified Microbacterium]|uniref:hypothetical protein n=1 Tax=unclassified Microbacterium TaxID=2609290 RepID=UPI001656A94A|nr:MULTISPECIES: hypothetical protein [unclassified Microbacterium]CAD5138477.1 conserved membrane protein of unknown function [Microbacterium sp. Nx66]
MDLLLPAASWLMAAAALVSAGACLAARRAVPWQGRQAAVVMAAGMLLMATGGTGPLGALLIGALLLVSGMIGTMGVRGATSAAPCCHRALGSLVMAICAFHGAAGSVGQGVVTSAGHGGHGLGGALGALVLLGTLSVVAWTIAAGWRTTAHRGRAARLLAVESWAMAIGVVAMSIAG